MQSVNSVKIFKGCENSILVRSAKFFETKPFFKFYILWKLGYHIRNAELWYNPALTEIICAKKSTSVHPSQYYKRKITQIE